MLILDVLRFCRNIVLKRFEQTFKKMYVLFKTNIGTPFWEFKAFLSCCTRMMAPSFFSLLHLFFFFFFFTLFLPSMLRASNFLLSYIQFFVLTSIFLSDDKDLYILNKKYTWFDIVKTLEKGEIINAVYYYNL